MAATRGRIENLVMRIQDDFVRTPWLALTVRTAQERFGVSAVTCEAVLDALAEAGVISKSRQGIYVRNFPEMMPRRGPHNGRGPARRAA